MSIINRGCSILLVLVLAAALSACGDDSGPKKFPASPDFGSDEDAGDAASPGDTGGGTDSGPDSGKPDPDSNADAVQPDAADAPDGGDPADADAIVPDAPDGDTEPAGCKSDAECKGKVATTACQLARCKGSQCVAEATGVPDCCINVGDCDDANDATLDTCPKAGGSCEHILVGCEQNIVFLSSNFDDGTKQGWTVKDFDSVKSVTWLVDTKRASSGPYSFYFGRDDGCPTYYTGPLGSDCDLPGVELPGPPQSGSLLSPELTLPEDAIVLMSFDVWADLELVQDPLAPLCVGPVPVDPCYDPELEELFDNLFVYVNYTELGPGGIPQAKKDKLWTTVQLDKSTGGKFVRLGADLTKYAGKAIKLELQVATDDNFNWEYEGVYIDNVRVQTGCEKILDCQNDAACESPDPCVIPECTKLVNGTAGACFGLKKTACVPCLSGKDTECPQQTCEVTSCSAKQCQSKPDASCCADEPVNGPYDFEAGKLPAGWTVTGGVDGVTWQVAALSPSSGKHHLYFGNPATGTYEAAGKQVWGSLTTPVFLVPATAGGIYAGMSLLLSTEWDMGELDPAFEYDRFTIEVLSNQGGSEAAEVVFDSFDIGGSTGDHAGGAATYRNAGFALTQYAGKAVRLRLTFDSGDGVGNDFAGVFIDDFGVFSVCGLQPDPCIFDGQCGDANGCTEDLCLLGSCQNPKPDPLCCLSTADCNDGNPCTADSCVDSQCVNKDQGVASCCFEATKLLTDFEGSPAGWTLESSDESVGWSFQSGAAFSGKGYLYFGDPATGTYQTSNGAAAFGEAIGPLFQAPAGGTTGIELMLDLSTEFDQAPFEVTPFPIDRLSVLVRSGAGPDTAVWTSDSIGGTTKGQWKKVQIGLAGYAGKAIQLVFQFDSGDAFGNNFGGVRIDSLGHQTFCKGVECFADAECPDDADPCMAPKCTANKCGLQAVESAGCCVQKPVLNANFDKGASGSLDGFAVTPLKCPKATFGDGESVCTTTAAAAVKWQPFNAQFKSPQFSLYFGNAAKVSYNDAGLAVAGVATSPPVSLYGGLSAKLDLWLFVDVEAFSADLPQIDMLEIVVIDVDGIEHVVWDKSELPDAQLAKWVQVQADLSDFNGQAIQLKLYFDSYDDQLNLTQGVFVDNVQVIQQCTPAP